MLHARLQRIVERLPHRIARHIARHDKAQGHRDAHVEQPSKERAVTVEFGYRPARKGSEVLVGRVGLDVQAVRVHLHAKDGPLAGRRARELLQGAATGRRQDDRERHAALPVHPRRLSGRLAGRARVEKQKRDKSRQPRRKRTAVAERSPGSMHRARTRMIHGGYRHGEA